MLDMAGTWPCHGGFAELAGELGVGGGALTPCLSAVVDTTEGEWRSVADMGTSSSSEDSSSHESATAFFLDFEPILGSVAGVDRVRLPMAFVAGL